MKTHTGGCHCGKVRYEVEIESFAKGSDGEGNETICVNVRCLDGVDLDALKIMKVNGKDF